MVRRGSCLAAGSCSVEDGIVSSVFESAENNSDRGGELHPEVVFIPTGLRRASIGRALTCWKQLEAPFYLVVTERELAARRSSSAGVGRILVVPRWFEEKFARTLGSAANPTGYELVDFTLPVKRTYILKYALDRGFERVLMLDDDIIPDDIGSVRTSSSAVINAGCLVSEADISIVDRIESRLTGIPPAVSVSASFLYFDPARVRGFFPYVYNEDWIFFWINQAASVGISQTTGLRQLPAGRWKSVREVRFEQFGDVIAFGIRRNPEKVLRSKGDQDLTYWMDTLSLYQDRLGDLIVDATGPERILLSAAQYGCEAFGAIDFCRFFSRVFVDAEEVRNWKSK